MCAYANNQHHLEADVGENPRRSSWAIWNASSFLLQFLLFFSEAPNKKKVKSFKRIIWPFFLCWSFQAFQLFQSFQLKFMRSFFLNRWEFDMKSNWPNFFEILTSSSQEQLLPCHATLWRCGAAAGWPSHTFHADLVLHLGVFKGGMGNYPVMWAL